MKFAKAVALATLFLSLVALPKPAYAAPMFASIATKTYTTTSNGDNASFTVEGHRSHNTFNYGGGRWSGLKKHVKFECGTGYCEASLPGNDAFVSVTAPASNWYGIDGQYNLRVTVKLIRRNGGQHQVVAEGFVSIALIDGIVTSFHLEKIQMGPAMPDLYGNGPWAGDSFYQRTTIRGEGGETLGSTDTEL